MPAHVHALRPLSLDMGRVRVTWVVAGRGDGLSSGAVSEPSAG